MSGRMIRGMPAAGRRRTVGRWLPALALAAVALGGGAARARAHTLTRTDGKVLEGRITEETEAEVVIETTFAGVQRVPRAQVKAVDKAAPPLRDQLAYRSEAAGSDPARLWELHGWARQAGFKDELRAILERIVAARPDDAKARKALGHEKVDGRWLSPEEKAQHAAEQEAAAMRAKGLVLHEGRWVTPQEKAALEQGLRKDGEDWVSEDEWHRRRGEVKVDGAWVRLGEQEGVAWAKEAADGARVSLQPLWTPHFDVAHEVPRPLAEQAGAGLESAYAVLRRMLRPEAGDLSEGLDGRVRVVLVTKAPAYARVAEWFGERVKAEAVAPGWSRSVQRQPCFWWADPDPTVAVYQFPNIDRTVVSNVVHNAALVLLTRYRFNFRFVSPWLREGFAYLLEMRSIGYSLTFTLGRGGGTNQGGTDTAPPWADSARWKEALKQAVAAGTDPPLKRLAGLPMEGLGYPELVKAWSVCEFLAGRDGAGLKAFVDAVKAQRDVPEEDLLRELRKTDFRQLDAEWRAWVGAGFPER